MYLRETRRVNKDGTVVSYLQLAHNERHPRTGSPVAKVIHNFGRSDKVDRQALARLVASISRFLDPEQAVAAAGAEVEVIDSRRLGGVWVLGRLWERLEIGTAIRKAAAGRRLDGETTERVIFALVAQPCLDSITDPLDGRDRSGYIPDHGNRPLTACILQGEHRVPCPGQDSRAAPRCGRARCPAARW